SLRLYTRTRPNQKECQPQLSLCRKSRKRIETLLSQACDQIMLRRTYAKSLDGFKPKILTQLTAMTEVQDSNNNRYNANTNNRKKSLQLQIFSTSTKRYSTETSTN